MDFEKRTFSWVDTSQIRKLFKNQTLLDILIFGGFFYGKAHPMYHPSHDIRDISDYTIETYFGNNPQN